jgi:hypothetical protein
MPVDVESQKIARENLKPEGLGQTALVCLTSALGSAGEAGGACRLGSRCDGRDE